MTRNRYLILAILAVLAFAALLLGMPAYVDGIRAARAGQPVSQQSPWLTAAFLFGFRLLPAS